MRLEELPTVQGDPALLHQVLQNLIDNAAKYRDPQPDLRDRRVGRAEEGRATTARRGGGSSVADNGVGIPPEHLGKVFDVFTRASRATS